jgi:tetratricopeptide (TPR) repeat protein
MTNSISASARALVVVAALATTTGSSSRADEPPAAVQHFVAGKQLYAAHLFRRALAEFEVGYIATELPGFLLNMAQCHRQLGELEEAVRDYESYLSYDSTSGSAREVREIVAEFKQRLPPAPLPPPSAPAGPTLALVAPPAPAEPRAARPLTYAGVALSGTLLVTGGVLEIAAGQAFEHLRTTCGATVAGCAADERSAFDREYRAATGVLIVAAFASVATIAAALLEERARRARARGAP